MRAIWGTLIKVAEASRIDARCLVEACFARFDSRFSRCPSCGASSRTNASGGRIDTSFGRIRPDSTPNAEVPLGFPSNVMRGRTSSDTGGPAAEALAPSMTRVYRRPLPRALAHPAKDKVTVAAGAVVALVLLLALLAPLLTPYEPNAQDPVRSYEGPSWSHPFGTDQFGRDILTRLLFGARLSLTIGLGSVGVALAIGATLGVLSGFYRSVLDVIIMRAVDVALAFPLIIFSTLIVVVLGPSLVTVIFGVGV